MSRFTNGNKAAAKEVKAEAFLQVRCLTADKSAWVKAAQARDQTLSQFVVEILNKESSVYRCAELNDAHHCVQHIL